MYVATRGLYRMSPPTIFVPKSIKENVEKLFEAHRAMDQSELNHKLIGLDVGNASIPIVLLWFWNLRIGAHNTRIFNPHNLKDCYLCRRRILLEEGPKSKSI